MTKTQIDRIITQKYLNAVPIQISFKTRPAIMGLFIITQDYAALKSKNLWRIVSGLNLESYQKNKDISLASIFNGLEFTKLGTAPVPGYNL